MLLGTRSIDDIVGHLQLLFERQLAAKARLNLFSGVRTALHGAFHLLFIAANRNNQTVAFLITSSFNQNRRLDNYDGPRIFLDDCVDHALLARSNVRMYYFAELFE